MTRAIRTGMIGLAILFGIAAVNAPSAAKASFVLQLSDGTTTVTIPDGSGQDQNGTNGAITFIGSIGNWILNVTTGLGFPLIGSLDAPSMDLNSVDATSSGGGTLTIQLSETGFGPSGAGTLISGIGGTTHGTVDYYAYKDPSNTLFGTSGTSIHLGPFGGGPSFPFSGQGTAGHPFYASYSMTQVVTITHTDAGQTSFNAALDNPVPEPMTIVTALSAVPVLLLVRRRSKKA